jgi:hypothetical protein
VVNPRLKELMKELKDAIGGSLSESNRIAHVITKINHEGFDIFLKFDATVGFSRLEEAALAARPLVTTRKKDSKTELTINAHDARFLKSLCISVDDNT